MGAIAMEREMIRHERVAEAALITVGGELDVYTAPALAAELQVVADGTSMVVIDLSECEFLDSSGLHVLLSAYRRLADGGRELRLAAPRPDVQRVLDLVGVASMFGIYPSSAVALDGNLRGPGHREESA